jgi:hypothetical protein
MSETFAEPALSLNVFLDWLWQMVQLQITRRRESLIAERRVVQPISLLPKIDEFVRAFSVELNLINGLPVMSECLDSFDVIPVFLDRFSH